MPLELEDSFADEEMVLSEVFSDQIHQPIDYDSDIPDTGDDDEPDDDGPTNWLFDEPGMDDIMDRAGTSLQGMFDRLKVKPLMVPNDSGEDIEKILLARYELPQWGKDFAHPDAVLNEKPDARGWADFMQGVPFDVSELMGLLFEHSTQTGTVDVIESEDDAAPPMPDNLFEGFPQQDKLFELMGVAVDEQTTDPFADDLEGEEEVENPHFWMRYNLFETADNDTGEEVPLKRPVPGEFVGMGVRMFPDKPWGEQKSSPFLMSGNWFETVFYSSGTVNKVYPPDSTYPYPRYEIGFRKRIEEGETEPAPIIANPHDFGEYAVGDRVAVLKQVKDAPDSMTWKDVKDFDTVAWSIAPMTFYEDEEGQ